MILEIARITLENGADNQFLAVASEHGQTIFRAAEGCRGMQIRRSIENPNEYIMLVYWETLENHLVDFRASEGFTRWRSLTAGLYAAPARIENFEVTIDGFGITDPDPQ